MDFFQNHTENKNYFYTEIAIQFYNCKETITINIELKVKFEVERLKQYFFQKWIQ